jgi:uncharacterized membrane protein
VNVFGLPLHPLVVHGAVVLIPLACLGALAVLISARARERYGWLTVAFAVAAAGSAIVAKLSGEVLAATLGAGRLVATHEAWGDVLPYPTVALAVALPVALLLRPRSTAGWWVAAAVSALAAVAGLVLVALTGHSGATAVWGGT